MQIESREPSEPSEKSSPREPFATRWRQAAHRPVGAGQVARRLLRDAAISLASLARPGTGATFLRGLYCHYVFDDQIEAFDRILARLQRLGTFVDTTRLLDMLEGRAPIDGRYLHLSFDDGFRNNRTNAAPLLRRRGIPAVFFVASGMLGASPAATRDYCRRLNYHAPIEIMTWQDAAALVREGFEIGSHTRTHARFAEISHDPARLEEEIAGSKREIEARLGVECRTISFPRGQPSDADATSLATARAAGYRGCFAAYRGSIRPGVTDRFSIPRHHFEAQWPVHHVAYFARGHREATR